MIVEKALVRAMGRRMERLRYQLNQYCMRLKLREPMRMVNEKRQYLVTAEDRIRNEMERRLEEAKHRLELISGRLYGLSPLKRISNGFGFVTYEDGGRIKSVKGVTAGDFVSIRISDGRLTAQVTEVEESV